MSYKFEDISIEHQESIIKIFNYYIAAYDTVPLGKVIFERFYKMSDGYPFKVIKYNEKDIVSFAFLHPYHPADSFSKTAEIHILLCLNIPGKDWQLKFWNYL